MEFFEKMIARCRKLYSKLTVTWLRVRGGDVAKTATVWPGARVIHPARLRIGSHTFIGHDAWVNARGGVCIGSDALIGPYCIIHSANHKFASKERPIRLQGHDLAPVTIGDNVWVAARVTILPGVRVAEGSVIAAGAVVTKNTEAYGIYAGVPAIKIGER